MNRLYNAGHEIFILFFRRWQSICFFNIEKINLVAVILIQSKKLDAYEKDRNSFRQGTFVPDGVY